jgi:LuxR family maltose regulon positive regulatory protein
MHSRLSSLGRSALASIPLAVLPRLPPAHIPRPRLTEALLNCDSRLRLLCAPAGFGKSVLLNECARQAPEGIQLVWLELGGRALSPQDFYQSLAAAINLPRSNGDEAEALLYALNRLEYPLWVMLDDYPREFDAELDSCLGLLLEQAPAGITWWVSSRLQPGWNLPRLLLQGDLSEVDAQQMALTADELTLLLERHDLRLSKHSVEELLRHSEGWLAGVCLLLLHADEETLRERLNGGTLFLRDYIQREVLSNLSEELRTALFSLVHLPRFCAALCEHVLDGGGAALLSELRARQLFIRPLDSSGEWFRIWQPLALMLPRLPEAIPAVQIYVRACQWFATRGYMREAVEYALWAGQPEVAANYLQRFGQEQLLVGRSVSQFLKWRTELPPDLVGSTPRLITLQAWALIICARLDEAEHCITGLQRFLPQPDGPRQVQLLAHWQALMGVLQRQRGYESSEYCREALRTLASKAWSQRVLCHQGLAQNALARADLVEAELHISEGLRLSRLHGSLLFETLLNLDRIHLLELIGELDRALELADQSLLNLQVSMPESPVLGRMLLARAALLASQGRDLEASDAFHKGLREAEDSEDAHTIFGYLGLSELAARNGDQHRAFQHLREAERLMQWRHVPEVRYQSLIQMTCGGLWLRQKESGKAREALGQVQRYYQSGELLAPSGCYDLLLRLRRYLAMAEMLQGFLDNALSTLQQLLLDCERLGFKVVACECHFNIAEVLFVLERHAEAEHELRLALNEAEAMKLMKPLLELQLRRAEWLRQVLPGRTPVVPERRLVPTAVIEAQVVPHVDPSSPLSSRELAVLRLIAQGCSNQEIAEQLFISLHTVKTHARRINTKLGVARRTQAVARAKGMGLLG